MNPQGQTQPEAANDGDSAADTGPTGRKTPSTDMQPEDAGTPDSGNTDRSTAAEKAAKQTGKTDTERDKS